MTNAVSTNDSHAGKEESRIFPPSTAFQAQATVSGMDGYQALCDAVQADEQDFWCKLAREQLQWHKPFTKGLDESNAPFYTWFADGEMNVSYNCLDVHLTNGNADKTAIIFEADDGNSTKVSYRELHEKVSKFANGLRSLGIKKGDRVAVYMGMSPELAIALLACARIGAVHSVIFGGFAANAIADRVNDSGCVAESSCL